MNRIVIIGGGISGLAAAHRVLELNPAAEVTVLEASDRLGGIIQTDQRDGFLIERGPDAFITDKPHAIALAKRLGIESQLIQTNEADRRSFIVRDGRLRTVPDGFHMMAPSRIWPFLTSDILSLPGKLRMTADLFLRKSTNGSTDESLASFVRRRLGEEALARVAQPMVGGIYTADPETLSLRATFPRFLDMEQKHRSLILAMLRQSQEQKTGTSGPRYSLFVSFEQGMQVLVDELRTRINADLRVNTRVQRLSFEHEWTITTDKDEQIRADAVCLAVPAYIAAALLSETHEQLAQKLRAIKYGSTATINFGYRRAAIAHPLNGFGFVVPFVEKRSLLACTFSSVKFSGRAPKDHVLLRAFAGGALQPEVFALDEPELQRRVESDLRELLGIREDPRFIEVSRWERSMPQYEVGHLERVSEIEKLVSELPGLSLAGNAYRGPGIPDCIRSGEDAVESLLSHRASA